MTKLPVVVTLAVIATLPAAACGTEPVPRAETSTPPTASSAAPLQPASSEQPAPLTQLEVS